MTAAEDNQSNDNNNYTEVLGVLSSDELQSMYTYILDKLPEKSSDSVSQERLLQYRPDEWDSLGAIQKVQDAAKQHISETYPVVGQIEPRKFFILRTDAGQTYEQVYADSNNSREVVYTTVTTVVDADSYEYGETIYTESGEGFKPAIGSTLVHKDVKANSWKIDDPVSGCRLDLVIVFQNIDRNISYDYPMDQTVTNLNF